MGRRTVDFGIDLGTTNSAITAPDWDECHVIPSAVHVDHAGEMTAGQRAAQRVEQEPADGHREFKRLMGTATKLTFASADSSRTPEELSAEVLKNLCHWAREEKGEEVTQAVITVPALFEIPQNEATERAAALAGITYAPLLQEPIAAALAYGFGQERQDKTFWLIYDFGGGTFDASLVSLRQGRLAVVDHDGDNFLGGKDLDRRVLELITSQLPLAPPTDGEGRGRLENHVRLRQMAENLRIQLSQDDQASMRLPSGLVDAGGQPLAGELSVSREELNRVILPEISRSVEICERLLERNRLSSDDVGRLVLVGGVTQTPLIRQILEERLGIDLECELDPATTVARGAALHAQSLRRPKTSAVPAEGLNLRLEYPATSQDLSPYVVGRFLADEEDRPQWVELQRDDDQWHRRLTISAQGAFMAQVELREGEACAFRIKAGRDEESVGPLHPDSFTVTHGLAVAAPPLSRSLAVGLADNSINVYLAKGTSLPARAAHLHRTTTTLAPGQPGAVLDVPVVQGESERADRNRHIGTLCIPASRIRRELPANAEVEVTVEVDGSSTVRARAYVPFLDQIFEQVLSTRLVPATASELEEDLDLAVRRRAKLVETPEGTVLMAELGDEPFDEIIRDIAAASLKDQDAALRAQRRLLELHEQLDGAEAGVRWPQQVARAHRAKQATEGAVTEYGLPADQDLYQGLDEEVARAVTARDLRTLERKTGALWRLRHRVLARRPEYWIDLFWWLERRRSAMVESARADQLVAEGKKALSSQDYATLERVVLDLDALLAPEEADRPLGLRSHIR
jgi:molecular chaperone DnaK